MGGGASERDKEGEEKGREGEQRRGGGGRERESARARKRERGTQWSLLAANFRRRAAAVRAACTPPDLRVGSNLLF